MTRPRPRHDPVLASPFHVDWLDGSLTARQREDLERAVAEKAADVVRAARFATLLMDRNATELEIKVWLHTGYDPAYISVHVEPRLGKHYFLVMDAMGRERLGAVVFDLVASVTGDEVRAETRLFMQTIAGVLQGKEEMPLADCVASVQSAYAARERPPA